MEVATSDAGVLERDDGPVGQLLRAAGVVQGVAHQGRLEQGAEVSVAVATGNKQITFEEFEREL